MLPPYLTATEPAASQPSPDFVKGFAVCGSVFWVACVDIGAMLEAVPETYAFQLEADEWRSKTIEPMPYYFRFDLIAHNKG
jgi:pyrroloquinoline quinone (PQQ) biosynthesis protein C